jgi:protein SCO1/2
VNRLAVAGTFAVALATMATSAHAGPEDFIDPPKLAPGVPNTPPELMDVGVSESLDSKLPLDQTFVDHTGKIVKLGDYVDGVHPTVLVFAYHSCPTLCSLVQNGVVEAMKGVDWNVGDQYNAITISIDPRDTPSDANAKRTALIGQYGRPVTDKGWAFLTGKEPAIEEVTKYAGWHYFWDDRQKQYAHPGAIVLLKPNGRIARYLYGIEFNPKDLRLGLLEASEGKSISTFDRALLYCYQYDGHTRKYSLVATRVMRIGGGITVVALAGFLTMMWRREKKKSA